MRSHYDEHPEAFERALRRKEFTESLLAGTGLEGLVSSDPDMPGQARAKREVQLVIERAWRAVEQAWVAAGVRRP